MKMSLGLRSSVLETMTLSPRPQRCLIDALYVLLSGEHKETHATVAEESGELHRTVRGTVGLEDTVFGLRKISVSNIGPSTAWREALFIAEESAVLFLSEQIYVNT